MRNQPGLATLLGGMLAVLCLCLCSVSLVAQADDAPAQFQPQVWLNDGFYAYHFQRDRNLRNNALGLGVEYRYSPESAVTAGVYHNSNWGTSHYLAYYWRPLMLGPVRFGAIMGVVDGYPGTRKGGWFPAVLPTAHVEYGWIGLNVFICPELQGFG